jgi:hypothetical protein
MELKNKYHRTEGIGFTIIAGELVWYIVIAGHTKIPFLYIY